MTEFGDVNFKIPSIFAIAIFINLVKKNLKNVAARYFRVC